MLTCLAFAMALVLSPPSAAHAASGMHDGQQSQAIGSLSANATTGQGSDAHDGHAKHVGMADGGTADSGKGDKEQQTNQCCNGICIFVVIPDEDRIFPKSVAAKDYIISDAQTHSVETPSFLRPPRFLI